MRPQRDADGIIRYKLRPQAVTPIEEIRKERMADIVFRKTMASEKQIDYALSLLRKHNYPVSETDEEFEEFGLPVEPGISVEAWLGNLSIREIGYVISQLKSRPREREFS